MMRAGKRPLDIIKSRWKRLLVPYAFVGICYASFKLLISKFANKPYDIENIWKMIIGVNPDGELWFLYALFIITAITAVFFSHLSLRTFCIRSTSGLGSMAYCDKLFILFPVLNVYETRPWRICRETKCLPCYFTGDYFSCR